MAQSYQYQVRDQVGKTHKGIIEAENRDLVVANLRSKGYYITDIKEIKPTQSFVATLANLQGVTIKDLSIFSRQFSTMVSAGLPLIKSLEVLARQTSKAPLREAVEGIKYEVESGASLALALGKYYKVFPVLFVTMVRAGEVAGVLDKVLERLADHYEKEYEIREKVKTALRYPMAILFFALAIVGIMLAVVVPSFVDMFQQLGAKLPLPTRILISVSDLLTDWFLILLVIAIGVYIGLKNYLSTEDGRRQFDNLVIKIPIIGAMVLKVSLSRVCRTLGTLLSSGVPILQALEVVQDIAGNSRLAEGIRSARESIREGENIAKPLEDSGVFPPMVTQMIAVGEETGNLDGMLNKVSDFYDKEVKNLTDNISSLIEPIMIVILAVIVGGILISTMMPMFDLYTQIDI